MKFKRPRGTYDLFGEQMERWLSVEKALIGFIRAHGYSEIRTRTFESTDLFVRAVGEGTDIVSKEMYTFTDKKGRSLTLRPENTAPVMRAFIENGLHRKGGITRFYYIAPMFRYDRPQAGRYREFRQIGVEALGSQSPAVDAEVIEISLGIYRVLGYPPLDVKLNSVGCPKCRPAYKEVLAERLEGMKGELCADCRQRASFNPLRVFDCKRCGGIKGKLPVITDHLCEECRDHFETLKEILSAIGVGFKIDPLLVRGLDYYTKTAFEIIHPGLGSQNALCGGGRYDGLAQECGGGFIPAVGFSAGMERLIDTLPDGFEPCGDGGLNVAFIIADTEGENIALSLAGEVRGGGITATVDMSGRSVKKQLSEAASGGVDFTVFIGREEIEKGAAAVKDMASGSQVPVPFEGLRSYLEGERDR